MKISILCYSSHLPSGSLHRIFCHGQTSRLGSSITLRSLFGQFSVSKQIVCPLTTHAGAWAICIQYILLSGRSPQHETIQYRYLENLAHQLQAIANRYGGLQTSAARTELQALDPLTLTGPEAVTYAVKEWLNVSAGLRWNALTGLQDGGKARLVDDVLILPITSFR